MLPLIAITNYCSLSFAYEELGHKQPTVPGVNDPNLKVEEVIGGLHLPTHIAFLDPNDIIVLEKNNGTVRRVVNGNMLVEPLLDLKVANESERGMLGVGVSKGLKGTFVFIYFTEAKDGGAAVGNRLYRYEFINNKLIKPKLLLDLPATRGPYHNGGAVSIGPDGNVYVSVGDISQTYEEILNVNGSCQAAESKAKNCLHGSVPDGSAGILRVTQEGKVVGGHGILGNKNPLNKYYAYGIRNSFGISFDPVTGNLWDTENGPDDNDEVNLVKPGFNSGWNRVHGIWQPKGGNKGNVIEPDRLVNFGGKGKYSNPEFAWTRTVGPTAIEFINSEKLGKQYQNDIFVGDINHGRIYDFEVNEKRTGLILKGRLADGVADDDKENKAITLGHDFGDITDLKLGPDGYLYVVTFGQGKIFRIVPVGSNNTNKN